MAPILVPLLIALAVLAGLGVVGFLLPSPPLPPPPSSGRPPARVPIPTDVPPAVARYLRAVSTDGTTVPRVGSLAFWGTGRARPFGVWLPFRHRTTLVPGHLMLRDMVVRWYGVPLLHVDDAFEGGRGRTVVSGVVRQEARGPRIDQGAFVALAAESVAVPSTDALEGRWEEVGEHAARLLVPYRGGEEVLLVTFDPVTGLPSRIAARRYRRETGPKVGWYVDLDDYRELSGLRVPTRIALTWEDVGLPWSIWRVEGVATDVGVPSAERAATRASAEAPAADAVPAPLGP